MDLQAVTDRVPTFILYALRVGAIVVATPFFGNRGDTFWPRLAITFMTAAAMYLPRLDVLQPGASPAAWAVVGAREVVIGLLLGFGFYSLFLMLRVAGEVLGQEIGFSLAHVIDPSSGETSQVMSQLLETLAFLLFFALDGHLAVFRVLNSSLHAVPVGAAFDLTRMAHGLQDLLWNGFELAIRIVFPVLGLLLVATVSLLVLAKAVPQMNLLEMGFTVRMLLAVGALVWFLDRIVPMLARAFEQFAAGSARLVGT